MTDNDEESDLREKIPDLQEKIRQIEKERSSKALLYVTGGQELPTQIALDSLSVIKTLLVGFGNGSKSERITLLLRTLGGQTNAPWPIINLIREYCHYFEVVVVDKAFSAGTQICLGADKIVMTPASFLGPVDPRQVTVDDRGNRRQIEVEDIMSYFDFGTSKLRLPKKDIVELVRELGREIPPTKLGSIHRTCALIADISEKSLSLHAKKISIFRKRKIVKKLTYKLYAHDHYINRGEARDDVGFGDIIEYANPEIERILESLVDSVHTILHFSRDDKTSFSSDQLKGGNPVSLDSGILFSSESGFLYRNKIVVVRESQQGQKSQVSIIEPESGWKKVV